MKKLPIPFTSERIRGITLPEEGLLFVCDYDEVFRIRLSEKPSVELLEDDPYVFLESQKYFLGVGGCEPIKEWGENTISYDFDPTSEHITILVDIDGETTYINFETLSGDWFAASFSRCGKYLVIAEPYDYEIYKLA